MIIIRDFYHRRQIVRKRPLASLKRNVKVRQNKIRICGITAAAQPRFWREGDPILSHSTKRGSEGVTPGKFLKDVHAIWCICCIKIINILSFFSFFLFLLIFFLSFLFSRGGGGRRQSSGCATE